jgi:hypothetical protein
MFSLFNVASRSQRVGLSFVMPALDPGIHLPSRELIEGDGLPGQPSPLWRLARQ